jgi:conjugal transfer ATP-binding protein TraC
MITNSSIQMLLKQSPTTIDNLQKTFNLSDEEKYLLLESDVGEGIFFAGLKHVAIKVIASYTEDQIITSDPSHSRRSAWSGDRRLPEYLTGYRTVRVPLL